jgi:hypothetical protein
MGYTMTFLMLVLLIVLVALVPLALLVVLVVLMFKLDLLSMSNKNRRYLRKPGSPLGKRTAVSEH